MSLQGGPQATAVEQATAEIGLTPEQKKTLQHLFEIQMNLSAILREFKTRTGRSLSMVTARKYRERYRSQTYRDAVDHRVKDQTKKGCARCQKQTAKYPGIPWGYKRPICRSCMDDIINIRREEQWALAQERRAKRA